MKKLFLIILILLIAAISFPEVVRKTVKKIIPTEIRYKLKAIVFGESFLENMRYYYSINYGERRLPYTQFTEFDTDYISIANFLGKTTTSHYNPNLQLNTAFLESYENNILLIHNSGEISLFKDLKFDKVEKYKSNLNHNIKVVGSLMHKDELFLAVYEFLDNQKGEHVCSKISVKKSLIDSAGLRFKFEDIFITDECVKNGELGGELALDFENQKLFLSTGASTKIYNKLAQDDNSVYGKIIQINLSKNNESKIFSKGHRNPQGLLFIKKNTLISTEHGPFGGDEINKITPNKNYGWPISSYGENYGFDVNKTKFEFHKNHKDFNFEEPIFSFIPSIGISRIIKIPNEFSMRYSENYFLTSLNRRSIYRIKFDKSFSKILFSEEIRVAGRVRDIIYHKKKNSFILYLEDIQKVLIIKSKK